jgi:hypothetical protein
VFDGHFGVRRAVFRVSECFDFERIYWLLK